MIERGSEGKIGRHFQQYDNEYGYFSGTLLTVNIKTRVAYFHKYCAYINAFLLSQ